MATVLKRRIQLDDAMNWLNTLGGGYSALGDYFDHHVSSKGFYLGGGGGRIVGCERQ